MKTFRQAPYYDDYDENKKFHSILFRPSMALQAREANQLQNIIQHQIKRFGDNIFKNGTKVLDGQLTFDTTVKYLRVTTEASNLSAFIGETITGSESGVSARVVAVSGYIDSTDGSTLLIVSMISGGEETTESSFQPGEQVAVNDGLKAQILNDTENLAAIGGSSIAHIERGVYYVNGYFVLVDEQTIILDEYSSYPSATVGLSIQEKFVTENEDATLYDNAIDSYNYAAPGAHRYWIDLTLEKQLNGSVLSEDFLVLGKIEAGNVVKIIETTEYNELGDVLALRTYEESGDYTVNPFKISLWEHRSNARGEWSDNETYMQGDVVVSNGDSYVALTSGTSVAGNAPSETSPESGDGNAAGISWNKVAKPDFNDGIYPASGPIKALTLVNAGENFGAAPTITITSERGEGAEAVATISGGKINSVKLTNAGSGYTCEPITVSVSPNTNGAQIEAVAQYGDESKFVADISMGKAYVRGYRISKVGSSYVEIRKAREFVQEDDHMFTVDDGSYVIATAAKGPIPVNSMKPVLLASYKTTDSAATKYVIMGSARIRAVNADMGSNLRFYLTDIKMNEKEDGVYYDFNEVTGIVDETNYNNGTKPDKAGFRADFLKTNGSNTIFGSGDASFFKLPHQYIRSVSNNEGKLDIQIRITRYLESSTGVFGAPNNTTFAGANDGDFLFRVNNIWKTLRLVDESSAAEGYVVDQANREIVYHPAAGSESTATALIATLNLSDNNTAELRRVKTEVEQIITVPGDQGKIDSENGKIMLGVVDASAFESVIIDGRDVTEWFELMTGQTDSYYGESYLQLKSGYANPLEGAESATVEFTYYKHGSTGYFYTADSYMAEVDNGDVDHVIIPTYNGVSLRDVIDFRPDLIDGQIVGEAGNALPLSNTTITADYSYYLGRKDRIILTKDGDFIDVEGVPSLEPKLPEIPENCMVLFNLTILPYTEKVDAEHVIVDIVDNRRYTMRDIGKLESRISNLEEYTTLSLLEQQTATMGITDSEGYTRFANGFVVDNFKGSVLASETDKDYNCAMDMENGICRPAYDIDAVDLILKASSNDKSSRMLQYGKVMTLPLDPQNPHVLLCSQQLASKTESVNPYAVATFYGTVKVNPATDDWYDTEYKPNVVVNVEGNYSAMKATEGTVWNNWQTVWTGAAQEIGSSKNSVTTQDAWNDGWGSYTEKTTTTTTKTYAQTAAQTRPGLKTTVSSRIDYQEVGDKLVSTSMIPYMRSRYLLVKAKGLKPFTKFTPKFDNVDVSYWCTPASVLKYTPINGKDFDTTTMAGAATDQKARWILGTKNSYWAEATEKTCLDVGDVITGDGTNGFPATAVVVGQSRDPRDASGVWTLYLVNIHRSTTDGKSGKEIGDAASDGVTYTNGRAMKRSTATEVTFKTGSEFTGSISGAKGKVWDGKDYEPELNRSHFYDDLVSNHAGELYFLFWIPDKSKLTYSQLIDPAAQGAFTFECGDKTISVVDVDDADDPKAETVYSAAGILNTREKTINAVRNAQVVTSAVSENRSVTNTWSTQNITTSSKSVNLDPLSETFLVKQKGGAFLSKVDIYFAAKDESLPVTLQIRTVDNGYPTTEVLAFAEVVKNPSEINLSSATSTYVNDYGAEVTYPTFDAATTFEFESPVYVEQDTEYAIVLLSNSNKYRVWIAQVGDTVPGSTELISKQPFNGVLFKSQNGSTWTAEQNQDLKFNLWRANFVTGKTITESFIQPQLSKEFLENDPFETFAGQRYVRVWHKNHGFNVGDTVSFEYYNPNDTDAPNNNADYLIGTVSIDGGSESASASVNGGNTLDRSVIFSNAADLKRVKIGTELYTNKGNRLGYFITEPETSTSSATIRVYDEKQGKENNLKGCYTLAGLNGVPMSAMLIRDSVSDAATVSKMHTIVDANKIFFMKKDPVTGEISKNDKAETQFGSSISADWYVIQLSDESITAEDAVNQMSAGYAGGKYIMADKAIKYDIFQPCVNYQNFDDTRIAFTANVDIDRGRVTTGSRTISMDVAVNNNNELRVPCRVANAMKSGARIVNEQNAVLNIAVSSNNPALTPVIDSERVSMIFVHNLMDNPSVGSANALASYITKEVALRESCDYLKIMFAYNLPGNAADETGIKVYAKTMLSGQSYDDTEWTEIPLSGKEVLRGVPTGINNVFYDATYNLETAAFNSFALRIDFVGNNTCAVPKIQQLRVIAGE